MKKGKLWIGLAVLVMILAIFIPKEKGAETDKNNENATSVMQEQTQEDFMDSEVQKEEETLIESEAENLETEEHDAESDVNDELPKSSTVIIEPEISKEEGASESGVSGDNFEEHGKLQFPLEIPGYDMEIVAMGSYTGVFVEDGTNENVSEIAMLQVKNTGDSVIEYAELQVVFSSQTLNFKISALPAGERAVLLEQQRKVLPEESAEKCIATVVQREQMGMSEKQVTVTDEGNNRLRIKNLTNEKISNVRVFYKYYMEDKKIFLGGIAFSVKLSELEAGEEIVIQPAHYQSESCRIVMVSTYDM